MKVRPCTLSTPTFPFGGFEDDAAVARCAVGVVDRAKQPGLGFDVRRDVSRWSQTWSPVVITATPQRSRSIADLCGDPASSGGVLAVHDNEIDATLFQEDGNHTSDGVSARFTNNVSEKKYAHSSFLSKNGACTV